MRIEKNGDFIWSSADSWRMHRLGDIEGDSNVTVTRSLVSIPRSDINEEYVLHIGGATTGGENSVTSVIPMPVFKFNGTWSDFGMLNKPRTYHSSIYWNGAVYVIGGFSFNLPIDSYNARAKMEIWKIEDSPDEFKTSENWPELNQWMNPYLFIVPDSFFPDY